MTTENATLTSNARGSFQRAEGFDITVGRVLVYTLDSTGFSIVAHRFGVAFRGTVPLVDRNGMDGLKKVLDHAVIHHEHLLATWDLGKQTYLSESEVESKYTAGLTPQYLPLTAYAKDVIDMRLDGGQ